MKNNANALYESVIKALEKIGTPEETNKLILGGLKLIEESVFPTFDSLSLACVNGEDKNNSLELRFNCRIRGVLGESAIFMNVMGDELRITNSNQYIDLILSANKRKVLFAYDDDVICVQGIKEVDNSAVGYSIKHNGGFKKICLSLYCNSWGRERLNVASLEPEFRDELEAKIGNHPDAGAYFNTYWNVHSNVESDKLEKNLDDFIRLGIAYRNFIRERYIDIYNPVIGKRGSI